jgi:hypothetical protein
MLKPTDNTFFPLVANAFLWGRVSGPTGLAPEALQGVFREILSAGVVGVSTGISDVATGFGDARATNTFRVRCIPRRCSRASSPRDWAHSRRSGRALRLVLNAPSPSLRGTEGEVSATPIDRVADCGFLIELLAGGSSGRPCPDR